jgi:hypothetical protein
MKEDKIIKSPSYDMIMKIKPKGRHFETNEAEWQAVLNTLTELDFEDAFKKWQKLWELCIRSEGDYFEGDGGQ